MPAAPRPETTLAPPSGCALFEPAFGPSSPESLLHPTASGHDPNPSPSRRPARARNPRITHMRPSLSRSGTPALRAARARHARAASRCRLPAMQGELQLNDVGEARGVRERSFELQVAGERVPGVLW